MNTEAAKQVLIACRPGTPDLETPEAQEALAQVRHDPDLQQWWSRQQAFHQQTRAAFRQVPVPARLRDQILARSKTIEFPRSRRRMALGLAAAAVVLLAGALAVLWKPGGGEDSFETFRSRMVRNVLRQYAMDVETNDMGQIRSFLASRSAPADYVLPPGLAKLPAMGAGVLSWRDRRVSMVCIDSRTQGTLFLFVVDERSVKESPRQREFEAVSDLMTASWSEGGKTYVLAGSGSMEWMKEQL